MREDNRIIVAGTGPIDPDGQTTPGGAAAQAARCFELIIAAIEDLGGRAEDVVRTRMFLTDFEDQDAVGEVHARYFGKAKPAATMAGVAWLCGEDWKVEIEAEALLQE
ncbi:MAG: RidA family protein [Pseudomonadota bacterium]